MFTTEPAAKERQEAPARRERSASPFALPLAQLTDPAWILATLWRRRGLILLMAALGFALGVLVSFMIPPKYVSTAQLFIDPRDLRVLQNDVSPNTVGSDPTSIAGYLESQARVIASDSIKSRVVERLGLDKDPDYGGGASSGLFSGLFPSREVPGSPNRSMLYALAALDKNVAVRRGERTFVIDISATAQDPDKAAKIANAMAEAFLEDQAAVRSEAAQRATAALTGRLQELRNRLRIAEDKAQRYREANNLVGIGGKSLSEEQLALNNAQLVAARTRTTEAKAKYDQIINTRAASLEAGAAPEAVSSNTMTALRAQLGAALAKEADLVASLGERHPALTAAQAQVRDARRQITEELARIGRSAKVEYDRAVDAERQLASRVDQLTTTQYAAGRASVELRELEREVESSRAVYEAFLRRARETGELGGVDTTNARVISQAMPPLEKSGISRRTLAMLGTVAGGGLGVLLALSLAIFVIPVSPPPAREVAPARRPFWRRAPRAVTSPPAETPPAPPPPAAPVPVAAQPEPPAPKPILPAQAEATSGKDGVQDASKEATPGGWRRLIAIPGGQPARNAAAPAPELRVLGTVPNVRNRRWRSGIADPRSVFQSQAHLVDVVDKPQGAFARAIAALRDRLAKDGSRRRILVLGLQQQAGATTIALNLALDAAQAGLPALLVDAGEGSLGLTRIFAVDAPAGLGEVIAGNASVARTACKDEGTGLAFLPRVGSVPAPGPNAIQSGLFAAAHRFGPIIVDGGSRRADPLVRRFAEAADDIVLVARGAEPAKAEIERWQAELGPQAAKLAGIIVNAA